MRKLVRLHLFGAFGYAEIYRAQRVGASKYTVLKHEEGLSIATRHNSIIVPPAVEVDRNISIR